MKHQPPDPTPPQDTCTRLMDAALLVFADKGFDGSSIREIAELAKANSALIQYHFGGKEGLYKESLRYAFQCAPHQVLSLPKPPDPSEPGAQKRGIELLRAFIAGTLEDFLTCHGKGLRMPLELEQAAMTLWNREMQDTRPSMEPFILETIRPFRDYMRGCLKAIRPEFDEETTLRMSFSIQSQLLFLHKNVGLIRLIRGKPYEPSDLESLVAHITEFSLRGLGVYEAFLSQGA